MQKRQRRQSQNSKYMRQILDRIREYDIDEIKLLCDKWKQKRGSKYRSR